MSRSRGSSIVDSFGEARLAPSDTKAILYHFLFFSFSYLFLIGFGITLLSALAYLVGKMLPLLS